MTETHDLQSLRDSRDFCTELTKAAAKNFYYGLRLLPEPKRSAMFALYAYMRLVDDIADEEDGRTPQQHTGPLDIWPAHTYAALPGRLHVYCSGEPRLWSASMEMTGGVRVPAHHLPNAIRC